MAGPALAARAIISWALRATKQLSPTKRTPIKTGWGFKGGKVVSKHGKVKTELRPWMKGLAEGDKSVLGKLKIGPEGRTKFVSGYTGTYKHVKKHKKLYGSGAAGAAIWDFLPGKDNA